MYVYSVFFVSVELYLSLYRDVYIYMYISLCPARISSCLPLRLLIVCLGLTVCLSSSVFLPLSFCMFLSLCICPSIFHCLSACISLSLSLSLALYVCLSLFLF